MILVSPEKAAQAIGAKCGGSSPSMDDPQLRNILCLLTPLVEAALNVESLTRGEFTDAFDVGVAREPSLRLRNGFIVPDSVTVLDSEGEAVDLLEEEAVSRTLHEYGILRLGGFRSGEYTVTYTSGFEPEAIPDPEPEGYDANCRTLLDIPTWIEGIVITYLVEWYRNNFLAPKRPKDIPWSVTDRALQRSLQTRIYGRYQRPRFGMTFGEPRDS